MAHPPKHLQSSLPSYNLKKMEVKNAQDKREIVTQVLNTGDQKAVKWLFKNYPKNEIKKNIKDPKKGSWFAKSLNYWQTILKVDIPKNKQKAALINLKPKH